MEQLRPLNILFAHMYYDVYCFTVLLSYPSISSPITPHASPRCIQILSLLSPEKANMSTFSQTQQRYQSQQFKFKEHYVFFTYTQPHNIEEHI